MKKDRVNGLARTRRLRSRDDGVTVIELLVSMGLLALLAGLIVSSYQLYIHNGKQGAERSQVHGAHLDTSSLLARDVKEGVTLKVAETHKLSVDVVRDGVCWNRTYDVTDKITVTTVYYEQEACRGPSESKTETLVDQVVTADSKFTYFTDTNTVIPMPVDDLRTVKRISWDMSSQADGWKNALTYSGSANYSGLGDQTGTGVDVLQAKRPVLMVVTGAREGRDAPELSWTNPNPAEYVSGWVVLRSANPEGKGATDADRGTWQQVGAPLPVGVTTFRDTTLPAGYTATYTVRPNLSDGTRGPESNSQVTGLRPAQVAGVAVAGAPTSITVTWSRQIGATGYDLYRDNVKVASVGDVATWTDTLTYGHAHNYTVVGANRWESLISAGSQDKRTADGHQASESFPPTGMLRFFSAAVGAFTAPAAPTMSVTPNADWSYTLSWAPAGWNGAGPQSLVAHRDRGWKAAVNGSGTGTVNSSWPDLWSGAENPRATTSRVQGYTQAAVAGQYRHFRLQTCNEIGCSPVSATANGLQRAATPASCTVATADVGTRNVNVTINPTPTVIGNTGYWLSGGVGDPTSQGDQSGNVVRVDQLRHSTSHTFTVRSRNASPANSGYSDNQTCAGTTAPLGAGVPSWTSTTRKVDASFTPTNGTSHSISLAGTSRVGTSGSWDPLSDNTAFTVTSAATDGYNTVSASATARTKTLATPAVPSCSVQVTNGEAPGAIKVTGGDRVRMGASATTYASPHTFSGLGAGTYSGSAQNTNTDGYNSTASAWGGCGSGTIVQPFAPSAWGSSAPGCPILLGYVRPDASSTYQIRRSAPDTCDLRWVVSAYGDTFDRPAGTVLETGSLSISARPAAYTRTSGAGQMPVGPLVWPQS